MQDDFNECIDKTIVALCHKCEASGECTWNPTEGNGACSDFNDLFDTFYDKGRNHCAPPVEDGTSV